MLDASNSLSFDELLDLEAEMQAEAGGTRDHREAVAAFLRKEQVSFEGR
jgi:enoyl-CoA hydratase/carnithine racemase